MGRAPYRVARADGPGGQPLGYGYRQPIAQIGGKGCGNDKHVGYDASKHFKGRKIHVLVVAPLEAIPAVRAECQLPVRSGDLRRDGRRGARRVESRCGAVAVGRTYL
jgi:hypothetical protein